MAHNKLHLITLFFLGVVLTSFTLGATVEEPNFTVAVEEEEQVEEVSQVEEHVEVEEEKVKIEKATPTKKRDTKKSSEKPSAAKPIDWKASVEKIKQAQPAATYTRDIAEIEMKKIAHQKERESVEKERVERMAVFEREKDTLTKTKIAEREQRDKDRQQLKVNAEEEKSRMRSDLERERAQLKADRERERIELERQKEEERHQHEIDLETQIQQREKARLALIQEWTEKNEARKKQIENQRMLDAEREMEVAQRNAKEDELYRARQTELDLAWSNAQANGENPPSRTASVVPIEEEESSIDDAPEEVERNENVVTLDESSHEEVQVEAKAQIHVPVINHDSITTTKEKLIEEILTRKMNVREAASEEVNEEKKK